VTRRDWVNTAHEVLIAHGVEQVKSSGLPSGDVRLTPKAPCGDFPKAVKDLPLMCCRTSGCPTNTAVVIEAAKDLPRHDYQRYQRIRRLVVSGALHNSDFAILIGRARRPRSRAVLERSDARGRSGAGGDVCAVLLNAPERGAGRVRASPIFNMQIGYNDADLGPSPMAAA